MLAFSLSKPLTAHAADINLHINAEGQVEDELHHTNITSELHRGWRQDILFISLHGKTDSTADQFSVKLTSDVPFEQIDPKLYTIHGAEQILLEQSDSLRIWTILAPPNSQVTIVAEVPAGVFPASISWQILQSLGKLSDLLWFMIAGFLPILTFTFLSLRSILPKKSPSPPDPEVFRASPAAITVLLRGYVSRRAIAATLLDLAYRGHIQMLVKAESMTLYRKPSSNPLREHETKLLQQWFGESALQVNSNLGTVQAELQNQLISKRSQDINLSIYREIEEFGWFTPSPLITHWKLIIVALFVSLLWAVVFVTLFLLLPSATPLLWACGSFFVVIGLFTTAIPTFAQRNSTGKTVFNHALGARAYLAQQIAVHPGPGESHVWQAYLPFAIATDIVPLWMARWQHVTFEQPTWFLTVEPLRSFDEFLTYLNPVLEVASDSIRDKILPAYA